MYILDEACRATMLSKKAQQRRRARLDEQPRAWDAQFTV